MRKYIFIVAAIIIFVSIIYYFFFYNKNEVYRAKEDISGIPGTDGERYTIVKGKDFVKYKSLSTGDNWVVNELAYIGSPIKLKFDYKLHGNKILRMGKITVN